MQLESAGNVSISISVSTPPVITSPAIVMIYIIQTSMIDFLLKAIKKRLTRSYSSLGHERLLRDSTDKQKKLD